MIDQSGYNNYFVIKITIITINYYSGFRLPLKYLASVVVMVSVLFQVYSYH